MKPHTMTRLDVINVQKSDSRCIRLASIPDKVGGYVVVKDIALQRGHRIVAPCRCVKYHQSPVKFD